MKTDALALIIFGFLFVAIIVVSLRDNMFRDLGDMSKTIQIGKHDIDYQLFPARSKPLVLSTKELALRQFYPDFFKNFSKQDWFEFWDIIYGSHPLVEFNNEKLTPAKRSFYIQEIQAVLVDRYPEGFSHFSTEAWKQFWMQVYEITPGIPASLLQEDGRQKEMAERRLDRKLKRDNDRVSAAIRELGRIDELKK